MSTNFPVLPLSAAITAALLVSACGKQEAVGDVPSGEELAREADAASQAIREEAEAADDSADEVVSMVSYSNALRGFTIMVPESWSVIEETSDDNGQGYQGDEGTTQLQVGWIENRDDADWNAAVATVEDSGDAASIETNEEGEFRAATSAEGGTTLVRMLRQEDGSMIRAELSYAAENAESVGGLATRVMDSLALQ